MAEQVVIEQPNKVLKISNDLVSFSDCPNHCTHGYIIDPYKHKKIRCKYCGDKRKELARQASYDSSSETSILKKLNLQKNLLGTSFDFYNVINKNDCDIISESSLLEVQNIADILQKRATLGELPTYSVLINFGNHANIMNFVYPFLMKYFLAGVTVAPFLTCLDLCTLRTKAEMGIVSDKLELTYEDLIDKDICLILLESGTTEIGYNALKGLMELRAIHNKPTIIVTGYYNKLVMAIENFDSVNNYLYLATPYYIVYENDKVDTLSKYAKGQKSENNVVSGKAKKSQVSSNEFKTPQNTDIFSDILGI